MSERIVRIGCSSGFWGDSSVAAPQLVHGAPIDYLVSDYLAEITMSILARARAKDPALGYATDFVTITMAPLLREIAGRGIKVVSNAGGVNPQACAQALRALIAKAGLSLKVAAVIGDDLMREAAHLRQANLPPDYGLDQLPDPLMSMNAYLGAQPIRAALAQGADIVITGRIVDSALVLGPLLYEFDWPPTDYDRLAMGSLAGHIIECGAQCTGGLFTDWDQVPDWDSIGYPIIECMEDGHFIVTKPPGTGGLVNRGTVAEQILYEIGDPAAYLLPDVICDFRQIALDEVGRDRVRVSGAKGAPPTDRYKVSATYLDGYRASAQLTIGGRAARAKAEKTAQAILTRTQRIFHTIGLKPYRETWIEILGSEAMYGPQAREEAQASREVVLRLSVAHEERQALEIFVREIAPAGTSMAPGTTGGGGGRAKAQPLVRLFSCLVPKSAVSATLDFGEGDLRPLPEIEAERGAAFSGPASDLSTQSSPMADLSAAADRVQVPLIRLAFGRSGDKGNDSNIGIIARRPEWLELIRAQLGPEQLAQYFRHLVKGPVVRYDLPGLWAVNFVLKDALGGGGNRLFAQRPAGQGLCTNVARLSDPGAAGLAYRD